MTLIEKTLKAFEDNFILNTEKKSELILTKGQWIYTVDYNLVAKFITQALQEQERESRREVLKYIDSRADEIDTVQDWEKIKEDYAKQHNIDLHEN